MEVEREVEVEVLASLEEEREVEVEVDASLGVEVQCGTRARRLVVGARRLVVVLVAMMVVWRIAGCRTSRTS